MTIKKVIINLLVLSYLTACTPGGSKTALNNSPAAATSDTQVVDTLPDPSTIKELKPAEITRECLPSEVSLLKSTDQLIQNSNSLVDSAKGKKDDKVITAGAEAIKSCDRVQSQINVAGACRITKKTIIATDVSYYDAYRVDQKCKKTELYLTKNEARPERNSGPAAQPTPAPSVEVSPQQPAPAVGSVPSPVASAGSYRQCSADEFSNLSAMVSSLDLANKQIDRQGDKSNWKYDSDAISNSALATKNCETLVVHHDQEPCERSILQTDGSKTLRQYSGASLRQRCEKARTYFYEYVQNKSTLIYKNADLFLDVSGLSNKTFEVDYINEVQGCRVENKTGQIIDYSNTNLVKIKDTRGFEAKMMVLETTEGLLVQCYGLNIDGPFSKRELVKVLRDEGSDFPLVYKLK
jgi:hypothetical protein